MRFEQSKDGKEESEVITSIGENLESAKGEIFSTFLNFGGGFLVAIVWVNVALIFSSYENFKFKTHRREKARHSSVTTKSEKVFRTALEALSKIFNGKDESLIKILL